MWQRVRRHFPIHKPRRGLKAKTGNKKPKWGKLEGAVQTNILSQRTDHPSQNYGGGACLARRKRERGVVDSELSYYTDWNGRRCNKKSTYQGGP